MEYTIVICDFMSCFMDASAALSVCHASETTHMTQDMDNARTQPRSWSNIEDAPRECEHMRAPLSPLLPPNSRSDSPRLSCCSSSSS
eukprot:scaffold8015_cov149-Isochrysis_galbana.AAC.2